MFIAGHSQPNYGSGALASSPDGVTWTLRQSSGMAAAESAFLDVGIGAIVQAGVKVFAFGSRGLSFGDPFYKAHAVSTDFGLTWTDGTDGTFSGTYWAEACRGGGRSLVVQRNASFGSGVTTDGTSWGALTGTKSVGEDVATDGTNFVALTRNWTTSVAYIRYSTDGVTWSTASPPAGWGAVGGAVQPPWYVAYFGGQFVIFNGTLWAVSSDGGATWTQVTLTGSAPAAGTSRIRALGSKLFVLGTSAIQFVSAASLSGAALTNGASVPSGLWADIAYSGSVYAVVGDTTGGVGDGAFASSTDGSTWTSRTAQAGAWDRLIWATDANNGGNISLPKTLTVTGAKFPGDARFVFPRTLAITGALPPAPPPFWARRANSREA